MTKLDPSYFYCPSGRLGNSVPLIILLGFPASVLFAAIYAYVVRFCPVIGYVNILFLGAYIVGTGWVVSTLGVVGRCRNRSVLWLLGGVTGGVGLYFSWLLFFKALYGADLPWTSLVSVVQNPQVFWKLVCEVNHDGWWGPRGFVQWCLCFVEASGFLLGVGWLAGSRIGHEVFCEDCEKWCRTTYSRQLKPTRALLDSARDAPEHLEILKLPETSMDDLPRFESHLLTCPDCDTNAVLIQLHVAVPRENGDVKIETTDVDGIVFRPGRTSTLN